MPVASLSRKHPSYLLILLRFTLWLRFEMGNSGSANGAYLCAALGILKTDAVCLSIQPPPREGQNLILPATGEQQATNRGYAGIAHLLFFVTGLCVAHGFTERLQFIMREKLL